MSRLLSNLGSFTRRLFTPGTPPGSFTSPLHQAWMHEQMKEYSVKRLYAGPLDADLNPTGETWEMRLAYRSAMKEPAIKAPLLKKVYAVASLSPQVLPENPESPADKEAASWFDYAITNARGGWPRLLHDCCLHPLLEGFAIGEKVRERVVRGKWKDRWGLHAVKFKETRDLRFELDEYRNITAIRSFAGAMGGRRFDPDNFLKITHIPIFENPFGQSDLRAAYRAINLISASIKLRAILLENFSGPFLVYKYGSTARIEEARNALANARSRGYISIDKTDDLQVVNLATSAPDQFQTTIDDLRKEAATSIAGAYLQMIESSSPQGNSETHKSVSELFEWWLASTVAATINEQLIPDLHDEHYPSSVGRPHILLGGIDPNSAEKAAANLTAAKQLGLPTSKRRAYEQLDVEPPKDDDDFLGGKPPEPQPQQPQPGQQPNPQPPQEQPDGGDGGDDPFAKYRPPANTKQFADGEAPVPPELLAAILVAHADGDDAAVQALLELADDPQGLQDLIDDDGPKTKQFDGGWTAAKTKTGGTKAVNGSRTLYGQAAQRALANQGKTDRGEALPEHPIAMAKRLKAEREPSREEARKQWAAAAAGRDVKVKDLPALAGHLHALTRDEIKEHLRGLEQKVGGLKADLVQRMLDHVEGIDFSNDQPTPTESKAEQQKRRQEQEATGHEFRKDWGGQKREEAAAGADLPKNAELGAMASTADGKAKSTDERTHDDARRMATVADGEPGTPKPRSTDHTDADNRHYTDKNYDDDTVQRAAELAHSANELKAFSGKNTDYVDRVAKGARDRLEANANDAPDAKGGSGTRNGKVDVLKPKENPKTFHEQFFAADKAGRERLMAEAAAGEHGPDVQAEVAPPAKDSPITSPAETSQSDVTPTQPTAPAVAAPRTVTNRMPAEYPASPSSTSGALKPPDDAAKQTVSAWMDKKPNGFKAPIITPEKKQEYHANMSSVLSSMPAGCRKSVESAMSEFASAAVFHPDIASVTEACSKSSKKKEKNVGGFVTTEKGMDHAQIHVDGGTTDGANNAATSIYAHELGHIIDAGGRYSDDAKWKKLHKNEICNNKDNHFLSRYATVSPAESFAELHREIVEKGVDAVKMKWPLCVHFFQSKGLL